MSTHNCNKKFSLKKSASTSALSNPINVNLRSAKSSDVDYVPMSTDRSKYDVCKDLKEQDVQTLLPNYPKQIIRTRDIVNNRIIHLSGPIILNGKIYTNKNVAATFKKDYRMWMWKNPAKFKKSKSVAEHTKR